MKAASNKIVFTDLALARLKAPKSGQRLLWDQACKGLSLLISPRGTKAFRVLFKLDGAFTSTTIGHYGDITLQQARVEAERVRKIARDGIDPAQTRGCESEVQGADADLRCRCEPIHRRLLQGPSASVESD
jgi:Arm domain-containing DNA-binding protein